MAFKELIKIKWGHKGGALIQEDWCPCKKRKGHQGTLAQRKGQVRVQGEEHHLWPKREASGETNPASISSRTSRLQNCEKINFCWLSYPVCGILLWQFEQILQIQYLKKKIWDKGNLLKFQQKFKKRYKIFWVKILDIEAKKTYSIDDSNSQRRQIKAI